MWSSMGLWKCVEWAGKMSKYPAAAATKQSRSCDYHYSISSKTNNTLKTVLAFIPPVRPWNATAQVNKPRRQEGERARVMFKMLILFHIF